MGWIRKVTIAITLVFTLVLSGCFGGGGLPEGFAEDTVKAAAEETVMKMSEADFNTITDTMVREDLREALSAAVLENAYNLLLADAGPFESFGSEQFSGEKLETGEDFVVAVVIANYGNRKIVYTLSFDKNMEIIGFYMK